MQTKGRSIPKKSAIYVVSKYRYVQLEEDCEEMRNFHFLKVFLANTNCEITNAIS